MIGPRSIIVIRHLIGCALLQLLLLLLVLFLAEEALLQRGDALVHARHLVFAHAQNVTLLRDARALLLVQLVAQLQNRKSHN